MQRDVVGKAELTTRRGAEEDSAAFSLVIAVQMHIPRKDLHCLWELIGS